jgi:hypothetical protein
MRRGRTLHTSRRSAVVGLEPDGAWAVVASGASGPQWYVDAAPFVFRRWVDRLALGPALRREPPGRPRLAAGDRVGFWTVVGADHRDHRLALEAQVRAPGTVTLDVAVDEHPEGSEVTTTIAFAPTGVLGTAYLLADLPAREAVAELVQLHLLTILRRHDNPWATSSVDQV